MTSQDLATPSKEADERLQQNNSIHERVLELLKCREEQHKESQKSSLLNGQKQPYFNSNHQMSSNRTASRSIFYTDAEQAERFKTENIRCSKGLGNTTDDAATSPNEGEETKDEDIFISKPIMKLSSALTPGERAAWHNIYSTSRMKSKQQKVQIIQDNVAYAPRPDISSVNSSICSDNKHLNDEPTEEYDRFIMGLVQNNQFQMKTKRFVSFKDDHNSSVSEQMHTKSPRNRFHYSQEVDLISTVCMPYYLDRKEEVAPESQGSSAIDENETAETFNDDLMTFNPSLRNSYCLGSISEDTSVTWDSMVSSKLNLTKHESSRTRNNDANLQKYGAIKTIRDNRDSSAMHQRNYKKGLHMASGIEHISFRSLLSQDQEAATLEDLTKGKNDFENRASTNDKGGVLKSNLPLTNSACLGSISKVSSGTTNSMIPSLLSFTKQESNKTTKNDKHMQKSTASNKFKDNQNITANHLRKNAKVLHTASAIEQISFQSLKSQGLIRESPVVFNWSFENLTNTHIPREVQFILSLGPKFCHPSMPSLAKFMEQYSTTAEDAHISFSSLFLEEYLKQSYKVMLQALKQHPSDANKCLIAALEEVLLFLKIHKNICIVLPESGKSSVLMERDAYQRLLDAWVENCTREGVYQEIANPENVTKSQSVCYKLYQRFYRELLYSTQVAQVEGRRNPHGSKIQESLKVYNSPNTSLPFLHGSFTIHKGELTLFPKCHIRGWYSQSLLGIIQQAIYASLRAGNSYFCEYNIRDAKKLASDICKTQAMAGFGFIKVYTEDMYTTADTFDVLHAVSRIVHSKNFKSTCSLDADLIISMLQTSLHTMMMFTYRGKVYRQLRGLPRGACGSLLLARILLDYQLQLHECEIFKNSLVLRKYKHNNEMLFYISDNCIDTLKGNLEKYTQWKFSVEREHDGRGLQFMGLDIQRNGDYFNAIKCSKNRKFGKLHKPRQI